MGERRQLCEDSVAEAGTAVPVEAWMLACPLCCWQPALGPALQTKSSQLPSLVLCYLCEVCCFGKAAAPLKHEIARYKGDWCLSENFYHSVPSLKVYLECVTGNFLQVAFSLSSTQKNWLWFSDMGGRQGALYIMLDEAKTWWNSILEYFLF